MARPGFLLDRDGVLIDEVDYLHRREDVRISDGASAAIARLNEAGIPVGVCTNQAVVARGDVSGAELDAIHAHMSALLGARLDGVFVCPHHPAPATPHPDPRYVTTCNCRKPLPGLLFQARDALGLDLASTVFAGDRSTDLLAAKTAGAVGVGVLTGLHCQDGKYPIAPETPLLPRLSDAVDLAIDGVRSWQPWLSRLRGSVVLVGGHSRAGKTSAATALVLALRQSGRPAVHLSTDRWITPRSLRVPGAPFLVRIRHDEVGRAVAALLAQGSVMVPAYDPLTREAGPDELFVQPRDAVLVVDGLMATALAVPGAHRVVIGAEETLLQERRRAFYAWKGADAADTAEALGARADETDAVENALRQAELHMALGPHFAVHEVRP